MMLAAFLAVLLSISFVDAAISNATLRGRTGIPRIPVPEGSLTRSNGTALPPITTIYYFRQLVDHNNVDLGTFPQRYWANWEFYEEGGPIILMTPGESNADGSESFLTNSTINGQIAQQQKGATVLLEHRFFGYSNPYDNLTSQSLELLTIEQAIEDLVYFAQNVNLPFPGGDNVKPDTTPWVLVGGSYSGALTSWTMVRKVQPCVFHAGYSSSGVVEAIIDYYGYFTPILEYMPQNCSSDVEAVIAYLDQIHTVNDTDAIQTLKETFGLGELSHIDDFAAALQNNLFDWQSLQPYDTAVGVESMFYDFCDALEVKDGVNAPATGWGLENAISSWGSFWNSTYYAYICNTTDAETCLGTYNASDSYWTNVTVDNSYRSWFWMICNQIGFSEVGPPDGQPAISSRIIQPIYMQRQCVNMFPEKFTSPPTPPVDEVNSLYAGWNVSAHRLFFANGLRDPWREATVSADGLDKANTTTQPIYVGGGFHCSDMYTDNGSANETIYAVQIAGLEYMKTWLSEWNTLKLETNVGTMAYMGMHIPMSPLTCN